MLGVGATLSACGNTSEAPGKPVARPLTPQELDKALHDQVKTVVVIYAENRSFNNLFADFPGVEKPLSALSATDTGATRPRRQPVDHPATDLGGVLQVGPQTVDGVTYPSEVQFQENLPNAPFDLKGPSGEDLPLSLVTRDWWHGVLPEPGCRLTAARTMASLPGRTPAGRRCGRYAQSRYSLRLWDVAKKVCALRMNFFQGRFRRFIPEPSIPDQRYGAGVSERSSVGGQGADRHAAKR